MRALLSLALSFVLSLVWVPWTSAKEPSDTRYAALQAAYIYRLALFFDWPNEPEAETFQFCIWGSDSGELAQVLKQGTAHKTLRNKKILVTYFDSDNIDRALAARCNVSYVYRNHNAALHHLEAAASPFQQLIISSPYFEQYQNALVSLSVENEKITIYLDSEKLKQSSLVAKPALLSIAKRR